VLGVEGPIEAQSGLAPCSSGIEQVNQGNRPLPIGSQCNPAGFVGPLQVREGRTGLRRRSNAGAGDFPNPIAKALRGLGGSSELGPSPALCGRHVVTRRVPFRAGARQFASVLVEQGERQTHPGE